VIAIGGSSSTIANSFGLPVTNHLWENGQPLPRTKFYVPGSILQLDVDNTAPVAFGMNNKLDVFYDNSPDVRSRSRCFQQGCETDRLVQQQDTAPQWVGVGASHISTAGPRLSKPPWGRKGISLRPRDSPAGPTSRHVQILFNGIITGTAVSGKPTT